MAHHAMIRLVVETCRPNYWPRSLLALLPSPASIGGRSTSGSTAKVKIKAAASMLAASCAVYLINDVSDRHRDRLHPVKRHRPVASGKLPVAAAGAVGAVAAGVSLALAASNSRRNLAATSAYLAVNAAYNLGGKQRPWFSLFAVAAGVPLRVEAGNTSGRIHPDSSTALLLAAALAAAKRTSELTSGSRRTDETLPVETLEIVSLVAGAGAATLTARRHGTAAGFAVATFAATMHAAGRRGRAETIAWPQRNPGAQS